jgi:RHS repeat-associated protein
LWDVNAVLPQLALERDGSGAPISRFLLGDSTISMTSVGTASYYHYDGLGSVVDLTSASGELERSYRYEPFGGIRGEDAAPNPPANRLLFTSEFLDPSTNLYDLRARQYDPTIGRFLSIDPLEPPLDTLSLSRYAYALDDPTALSDPSGLACWSVKRCLDAVRGFIRRHPVTVGACAGPSVVIAHARLHGNGCLVLSTRGGVGAKATGGFGWSTALIGASVIAGGEISTATCAEDLRRWFTEAGASGGIGPVFAADAFAGQGHANQPVYGISGGAGLGGGVPAAEAHTGATYTYARTLLGPGCSILQK